MTPDPQPSVTVEFATQCADGEQIASNDNRPYPLAHADAYCPCGGPHWIGKRTVTYGAWERVEPDEETS